MLVDKRGLLADNLVSVGVLLVGLYARSVHQEGVVKNVEFVVSHA